MSNNKPIIKRIVLFILIDIILALLACFAIIYSMRLIDSMELNFYFGESHAGECNIAQLFYASALDDFSSNEVYTEVFEDNVVSFDISEIDLKNDYLRFDPFNLKKEFVISKIEFTLNQKTVFLLEGKQLKPFVEKTKGVKAKWKDQGLSCKSKKNNPGIVFNRSFSDKLYRYYFLLNYVVYGIVILITILVGLIQIFMLSDRSKGYTDNVSDSKRHLGISILLLIVIEVLLVLSVTVIYALNYFEGHFGQVPFGQLVYHLHTPLDGTDVSSYKDIIIIGIAMVTAVTIVSIIMYVLLRRKHKELGYVLWLGMVSVIMLVCSVYRGVIHFEVIDYYRYTHESTSLFDDNYVDGREVELVFPEKKRNLIYIFLESVEVTFSDTASGGAMEENLIPNLTKIAENNECFSDGSAINGAHHVSGATYTMGALAAQTSGVSINESIVSNEALNGNWESENNYLPGVWTIGDVLEKQGYNQEFLIGSKGEFAGRSSYFKGHGNYRVEDYTAAINDKRIPQDYKVWWGYEDEKLYQFAKEDILKLAKENKPFNFTMLTVDTHFTDGYKCELCDDKYDSQYSNVIACADGQVAEFIEWLEGQDFYEDTTIVICGDHLTPDSFYINAQGVAAFDRRTYTAVINAAEGKKYNGVSRNYTTLDMYPTTLSAMGVDIEGDRLGLGVDLYSDTPTLAEKYGLEYVNTELLKNSDYYTEKLLYK